MTYPPTARDLHDMPSDQLATVAAAMSDLLDELAERGAFPGESVEADAAALAEAVALDVLHARRAARADFTGYASRMVLRPA